MTCWGQCVYEVSFILDIFEALDPSSHILPLYLCFWGHDSLIHCGSHLRYLPKMKHIEKYEANEEAKQMQ